MAIENFSFSIAGFALGCAFEPADVVERAIGYLRCNFARNVVERAELEAFIGRAMLRRCEIERAAPATVTRTRH
jgi:hypothetical protein